MKLTEAKLKQMILDEIKSNLSAADQDQLYADIQLVRELTVDLESLRDERYKIRGPYSNARADKVILGLDPIPEIDDGIRKLNLQIRAISQKYNIRHYYDSPGNDDLINLMKKKLRRKSLEESKDRENPLPHLDKITDLFAKSAEDGKQAASFVGALEGYVLRKDPIIRQTEYSTLIGLRFKYFSHANEFYETLNPKLQEQISARFSVYGQGGTVNIIYPNDAY